MHLTYRVRQFCFYMSHEKVVLVEAPFHLLCTKIFCKLNILVQDSFRFLLPEDILKLYKLRILEFSSHIISIFKYFRIENVVLVAALLLLWTIFDVSYLDKNFDKILKDTLIISFYFDTGLIVLSIIVWKLWIFL